MENIICIFNANGTTFKNTIAELLGEHTLDNDNSKKVKKLYILYIKLKKNVVLVSHVNIVHNLQKGKR